MIPNKRSVPLLVLVLALLSAVLYCSSIHLFPSFIHAWTQSDRYAIALRFLDNGFDIFHPATFNLQTVDGITRVDLPLSEFIVALIMKACGSTAPVIFRLYTLCVSIGGLIYLYLLAKKMSGSEIKSWLVVLFVFFSPVYAYYQAGFIPSIPAIALVFAGYYYFFSYKENALKKHFYLAVAFLLLAALLRLPFVIFLFAVLLQQLLIYARSFFSPLSSGEGKACPEPVEGGVRFIHEAIAIAVAFSIFGSYYLYNIHLGRMYGNMFLDSLMPAKSFTEFKEILAEMYDHWCFHYFTMWHYILVFVLLLISARTFYRRKGYMEEDKKYWFQLLIIAAGTGIYFLLMMRQFYAHDYYFLDSLFVPTVLLFLLIIKNLPLETKKQTLGWGIGFGITALLFFISNRNTQAERYSSGPWDRVEITRQNFTGTAQFLDSIGVPADAKVLVIDAYTTNVPLILMNRKGYTVMGTTHKNIGMALQWCDWDYVAIQDIYLVSDVIKNYPPLTAMLECIGSTGRVSFYKKSRELHAKNLKQFLGITPERTLFLYEASSADTATHHAVLDAATEYGLTASVKASELKDTAGLKVLVSADLLKGSLQDVQLVASVSGASGQLFYQSFTLHDYFKDEDLKQSMEFQFVLPPFKAPADELKVYLWNPAKVSLEYDHWEVTVYK
ncbi:MAG: hypothetical protein JWO09_3624 [Bacteroidetes bacterium]|nr:hypothetical protein [Bacteroidota bacterium]